jgi:hypothetical protein
MYRALFQLGHNSYMDCNKSRNSGSRLWNPGQRTDDMQIWRLSSFLYSIPKPGIELGLSRILQLDTHCEENDTVPYR